MLTPVRKIIDNSYCSKTTRTITCQTALLEANLMIHLTGSPVTKMVTPTIYFQINLGPTSSCYTTNIVSILFKWTSVITFEYLNYQPYLLPIELPDSVFDNTDITVVISTHKNIAAFMK